LPMQKLLVRKMSETNQPSQPTRASGGHLLTAAIIGLTLIALLSLGLMGYNALNPHAAVTQQQLITSTQVIQNTQTVTSISTVTNLATVTTTTTTGPYFGNYGYGFGGYYQGCGYSQCPYYGPNYATDYTVCQAKGSNNTVQCAGYLYQDSNGCIELVIPIVNPYYYESTVYQYYSLHNLPSSHPPIGTWVTVTGQISHGYTAAPNGGACPGNYIDVTSISQ
jgi:hypothetical protein